MADPLAPILDAINGLRDDLRQDRKIQQEEILRIHDRIDRVEIQTREALALKADTDRVSALEERIEPGSSTHTSKAGWLAAILRSPVALSLAVMALTQIGSLAAIVWLAIGRLDLPGLSP